MSLTHKDNIPVGSKVAEWQYETPNHQLDPHEAISLAKCIRGQYIEMRKIHDERNCRFALSQKFENFASPSCFPKLFLMATSDKTTEKDFSLIEQLAIVRNLVNLGSLTEEEGAKRALSISVEAKSN